MNDDISEEQTIAFYYEKHHAIRNGDMTKLIELKKLCPIIFDKAKDNQIREIIEYAKQFQASDRYKELCRQELKSKLYVINNHLLEE